MTDADILKLLEGNGDALLVHGRRFARELQLYQFAVQQIRTKLIVLRDEAALQDDHNPIEHISYRVKSPKSIMDKLRRKGLPVTIESMQQNLHDIAGVRVTCSFISDTYRLYELLESQPDITTVRVKDYIENPKPNGYRGLHAIVEIPVHLSNETHCVPVEIQFRTIAMDFWANLEHKIYYKYSGTIPQGLLDELTDAATMANQLDARMQSLHREVKLAGEQNEPDANLATQIPGDLAADWLRAD